MNCPTFKQLAFVHSVNVEIFESDGVVNIQISKGNNPMFFSNVEVLDRKFLELFCSFMKVPMPMLKMWIDQADVNKRARLGKNSGDLNFKPTNRVGRVPSLNKSKADVKKESK